MYSCGLTAWSCNSVVVHATSPSLTQRFTRVGALTFGGDSGEPDPVQPRFAHEPNVVRGPGGEWVMYWTGCDPAAAAGSPRSCSPAFVDGTEAANCTALGDGSTPPTAGMKRGGRSNDHTWMSWSKLAGGPWSAPVVVLAGEGIDSNLSPVILTNGSLIGLWRGGLNATRPWSTIQRVTASNWKDASSYRPEYDDLFPEVHSTEDPHMYLDADGNFHVSQRFSVPLSVRFTLCLYDVSYRERNSFVGGLSSLLPVPETMCVRGARLQ
jgi:hypothetical protein